MRCGLVLPRDADALAEAIDGSLLAGRWDARVAAEAVLDAMRAEDLRVTLERRPPNGPHCVASRLQQCSRRKPHNSRQLLCPARSVGAVYSFPARSL
jgi:hypothetical protein